MKVLDIIKQACAFLGLYDDYKLYFEIINNENNSLNSDILPDQISIDEANTTMVEIPKEKQTLLQLLILSFNNIQEKIFKTIPLITCEEISCDNNKIDINSLTKKINKIIDVKFNNKNLKFNIINNFIVITSNVNFNLNGKVLIKYAYFLPKIENLQEDISFNNQIKERTFALGVASEYCYIQGLFDDAEIWNNKFLKELEEDKQNLHSFVIPKRSWR